MEISGLDLTTALSSLQSTQRATRTSSPVSSGPSFGEAVRTAVESLDGQQKGVEHEISRAVTGESPDLHQTIVSLQSADLSFQFALQVRNKLIGAYEEVMRMQV